MLQFLLPKEPAFFDHFEAHAAILLRAAQALEDLVRHPEDALARAGVLKDLEREANGVTRDCVRDLHSTFITPLERGDIHSLVRRLDEVVNHLDGIGRRIAMYKPKQLPPELLEMAGILTRAAEAVQRAVKGVREMNDPPAVFESCGRLVELEEETDQLYARTMGRLYEAGGDPLEVMKIQEIMEVAEAAGDAFEELGRLLEGVVLEHL